MPQHRVMMVSEIFPPGYSGGGWSTYHLAKALDSDKRVDVDLLLFNQDEISENDLNVDNVQITRFPNEYAYRQIIREIRKREDMYDVVQGQHSLTIPPLAFVDTPNVGVIRGYWPVCYRVTLRDLWGNHRSCGLKCHTSVFHDFKWAYPYKVLNHNLRKHLTKKVDLLAVRSKFVEKTLHEGGFEDTSIAYNFIPDSFDTDVEPKGEGDILFVGPLHEQKGPQLVLDSAPKILEEYPEQHFSFCGDGPLRGKMEERAEDLGVADSISFHGHVPYDEVKKRMKGARFLAVPPLYFEPLSRVIIEAQALGTPVITTNRGGNHEAVPSENVFDPDEMETATAILEAMERELPVQPPVKEDEVVETWVDIYNGLTQKP